MSSALAWLQLGGPAMVVLGLMSVAAVTLSIIKLWEFSEHQLGKRDFVAPMLEAWEAGQGASAVAALGSTPSPLAAVLRSSLQHLQDGRLSPSQTRERIERAAVETLEGARSHLHTLDLIAHLAPLVGLLGTVLGMIEAFQALQAAGDRVQPSILSGGIWQALLTTAVGLGIAIPTVAMVSYLERRVEALRHAMESVLTRLLTLPRVIG